MSFLTETEPAKYKAEKTTMLKQKKVVSLEDLVTPEGRLILDLAQVEKIKKELNQRVIRVSTQTEKGYVYLHQQMRRLALDLNVAA